MIDMVWLVCAFEFLSYVVAAAIWLYLNLEGNKKVDRAWWTKNGRFVRNATAGEISALERGLNVKATYAGDLPFMTYYGGSAPFTSVFVVILYYCFFWDTIYSSPYPGLLLLVVFLVIHSILHMQVIEAYYQTASIALKRLATVVLAYKFLVALAAILGMCLPERLGTELMVIDSEYDGLFHECMFYVLASWIVVYGVFFLCYARFRKATSGFKIIAALLLSMAIGAAYLLYADYHSVPDNLHDMLLYITEKYKSDPDKAFAIYEKFAPEGEDAVIRTFFGLGAETQSFYTPKIRIFYHVDVVPFMEKLSRERKFLQRITELSDAYPQYAHNNEFAWVLEQDKELFLSWYQSLSPEDKRGDLMRGIFIKAYPKESERVQRKPNVKLP